MGFVDASGAGQKRLCRAPEHIAVDRGGQPRLLEQTSQLRTPQEMGGPLDPRRRHGSAGGSGVRALRVPCLAHRRPRAAGHGPSPSGRVTHLVREAEPGGRPDSPRLRLL